MNSCCILLTAVVSILSSAAFAEPSQRENWRYDHGAAIRGDVTSNRMAVVFTGDELGEGTAAILDALKQHEVKGSFFVTGRFVRNSELQPQVKRMVAEGHYVGPHSDEHPLYAAWEKRGESLVTRDFFHRDIQRNIDGLRAIGALPKGEQVLFVPPYEWFNTDQVAWCRELGVELINFTPGSGSNRDYAPEGNPRFVASRAILRDILKYEANEPHGLNGFLLLMHLGSGRKDAFHALLPQLLDELTTRGYELVRADDLLED